jgi:hypothetical protein
MEPVFDRNPRTENTVNPRGRPSLSLISLRIVISGLTSAKLKLARAKKHLRAIKRTIKKYAAGQPHQISAKAKGKKKLNIPRKPPQEIAIFAGEMIYQMRSALDHLAFELVKRNPNVGTVDPEWREHCQFPLRIERSKKRNNFSHNLPGLSQSAIDAIERMQPYHSARVHNMNGCLRALVLLSNIDKHRHLNLLRPRVRQLQEIEYGSGSRYGSWKILERGAIIESPQHEAESAKPTRVHRRYTALVTFGEENTLGKDVNEVPLDILLFLILYQIEVFVIPSLRPFLK